MLPPDLIVILRNLNKMIYKVMVVEVAVGVERAVQVLAGQGREQAVIVVCDVMVHHTASAAGVLDGAVLPK